MLSAPSPACAADGSACAQTSADADSGSSTVNVVPCPLPALVAVIVPPCASTMPLQIASPNPSPPDSRVTAGPPCSYRLKMRGSSSAPMPAPVSLTETHIRPSDASHEPTVTVPPLGVNLI